MHNTSEASLILQAPSSAVNGESGSAPSEAFFSQRAQFCPECRSVRPNTIRYDGWPRVHAVSLRSAERTHITIVKVLCVKCSRHPVGKDVFFFIIIFWDGNNERLLLPTELWKLQRLLLLGCNAFGRKEARKCFYRAARSLFLFSIVAFKSHAETQKSEPRQHCQADRRPGQTVEPAYGLFLLWLCSRWLNWCPGVLRSVSSSLNVSVSVTWKWFSFSKSDA